MKTREHPSEEAESGLLAPTVGIAIASQQTGSLLRPVVQGQNDVAEQEGSDELSHGTSTVGSAAWCGQHPHRSREQLVNGHGQGREIAYADLERDRLASIVCDFVNCRIDLEPPASGLVCHGTACAVGGKFSLEERLESLSDSWRESLSPGHLGSGVPVALIPILATSREEALGLDREACWAGRERSGTR
jgi:hypothetical protein